MTQRQEQADQDLTSGPRLRITITGCPQGMENAVQKAARHALETGGHDRGELEVAIVSAQQMRRQHAEWMGEDSTTDVLSFDLREQAEARRVDGQLLVCKSVARRRARSRKTDWRGELLLYVVHGCLHLCGLDDGDQASSENMHRLEDEILRDLGWGPVFSSGGQSAKTEPTDRSGK